MTDSAKKMWEKDNKIHSTNNAIFCTCAKCSKSQPNEVWGLYQVKVIGNNVLLRCHKCDSYIRLSFEVGIIRGVQRD